MSLQWSRWKAQAAGFELLVLVTLSLLCYLGYEPATLIFGASRHKSTLSNHVAYGNARLTSPGWQAIKSVTIFKPESSSQPNSGRVPLPSTADY